MKIQALVLSFICAVFCVGNPATALAEQQLAQTYPIQNVREIVVGGGAMIEISQGDSESLRVEATKEVLERVSVDLTGHRLTLKIKDKNGGFFNWFNQNNDKVKFIVQVKQLAHLELNGAAQAQIAQLRGASLSLNSHGASRADIGQLHIQDLKIDISGAGRLKVSEIHGQNMKAGISGAAQMEVTGAGALNELRIDVSGASKYFAKSMATTSAWVHASGASHAELRVSEFLESHASGASHINYFGSPRTKNHSSGASRINSHGE